MLFFYNYREKKHTKKRVCSNKLALYYDIITITLNPIRGEGVWRNPIPGEEVYLPPQFISGNI